MISFENGLGLFLADKFWDRSLVERWTRWCRLLRNSSLVLHNSSLVCTCPSIVSWDASISAIRRFYKSSCSAWASACSLSFLALAYSWIHSWIRSCSRMCSSLASWRALMASMSCCKTGASPPSDPCGLSLCFSSRREAQSRMQIGSSFIRPHGWCQMFSSVDLGLTRWASSASSLSPLSALEQLST